MKNDKKKLIGAIKIIKFPVNETRGTSKLFVCLPQAK
jgi:hypothetical protein